MLPILLHNGRCEVHNGRCEAHPCLRLPLSERAFALKMLDRLLSLAMAARRPITLDSDWQTSASSIAGPSGPRVTHASASLRWHQASSQARHLALIEHSTCRGGQCENL